MPLIAALTLLPLVHLQVPDVDDAVLTPGLTVRMFQLDDPQLAQLPVLVPGQTPNRDELVATLQLVTDDFEGLVAPMATRVLGWLEVAEPGDYAFRLYSDDGSRLMLDGERVINHDGQHGTTPKDSGAVALTPGYHTLLIEHFDSGGASALRLEWLPPGARAFELVPGNALFTEDDPTRVTAPGTKNVIDNRKPGTGLPVPGVHPGWRMENLRPEGFEPKVGAMCFLPDGRLAFGTFDPLQRDERELPDIDSKAPDTIFALDVDTLELTEIASDVYEPSGLCVVDGDLYVSHRRAIDRLEDTDGDGFFETHVTVGEGWEGWNYHQFVFGLEHQDGKLYANLSTTMAPPAWEGMETNSGPSGPMRGGILELDLSSNDVRVIAGGTRTPNGIGQLSDGTLFYLDNQGTWMPASILAEVLPGAFYGHYKWTRFVPNVADRYPTGGHPSIFSDRERTAPALWLPQNEVCNSPTQPVLMESPFDKSTGKAIYPGEQILMGDVTAGGIRRVFLERVDGVLQGALFRFSQGFEAGVNRLAWGPDGKLYAGGMGAGGNWNWKGTQFGLERLVQSGEVAFEMASVSATPDGFEIAFTQPVGAGWLKDADNFRVASWTYKPTSVYGGPKIDELEHRVIGLEPAKDRRSVRVRIAGLETGRCVHLAFEAESQNGTPIWSGETWYTLNRIPEDGRYTLAEATAPLAAASQLMPRGVPVQFWQGGPQAPEANRSQVQMMAEPGYFELGHGSTPIESSTEFNNATVELEYWIPEGFESRGPLGLLTLYDDYNIALGAPDPAEQNLTAEESGAFMGMCPPMGNASTGPGTWQTLRVIVGAPSVTAGEVSGKAWFNTYWNGRPIQSGDPSIGSAGNATAPSAGSGTFEFAASRLRIEHVGGETAGPLRVRNVRIEAYRQSRPFPPSGPWMDLLADADRWAPLGGNAVYAIDDGVLTGETRPNTPNTYFASRDTYGDFELLYEFNVHPELNSGVQIRSQVVGSFEQRDSGLKGYQVEIDPSERSWTAGIYDERGRGWLYPLIGAPYARRAFRQGEWNRVRVLAEGPRLRTWINGVPAADVTDVRYASGHLGFQVHGVGGREEPLTVKWRNVRLREL